MAKLELRFPDGLKETHELLQNRSLVIGSDETCDVRLFREGIQPKHAMIRWVDRRYHLDVDPLAKNVFVGVNPVTQLRLKPDAEFSIGDIECRLKYSPDELGAVKPPTDDPWSTIESHRRPALYESQSFLGIVTGLAILAILSVGLFFLVRARRADDLYTSAQRDMNDALYAKAVVGFDEFLKAFPSDARAPEATYLRAKARVEQYTEGSALSWPSAFGAAQTMMTEAASLPEFKKHPTEISDLIIKIARGLAEQSRDRADQKLLDQSGQALTLLTKYLPSAAQKNGDLNRIQSLQQEASLSVAKGGFVDKLLARMDASLSQEKPLEVYRDFVELTHRYPDRVNDKRVRERLDQATDKEKALVTFEPLANQPAVTPNLPATPSWSRYIRSAEIKAPGGAIIPITVADVLYGIDSKTGEVKWRRPIGTPTAFRPTRISSESDRVVAYRPDTNELLLIDAKTGLILKGISLGSMHPRLATDITVAPGKLFIVATSVDKDSKGYVLEIQTGEDRLGWAGTYQIPQPILTAPAFDLERHSLMVIAEEGSLFVIDAKTNEVESVIALGHEAGSVRHRPVMTGRFLFFDQFTGVDSSLLRSFVVSAKDGSTHETTPIQLKGHAGESPTIRGGRLFVATDRGEYSVFELGAETDPNPLRRAITYMNPEATTGVPAFIRAVDESDIWIFSGSASHFAVNIPRKELELLSNHPLPGPANRESAVTEKDVWAVTANTKLAAISALRIDSTTKEVVVTTTLGMQPIDSGSVVADNSPKFLAVYPTSRELISDADISKDTIIEQITPSIQNEAPSDRDALTVRDWAGGIVQVSAGKLLFAPATASKNEGMRPVKLTGNVGGLPATCGSGILVPSEAGYIYWINSETGEELADPFAAPFENGQSLPMKAVVSLDDKDPSRGAVAAGGKSLFNLKLSEGDTKIWQQTSKVELPGDGIVQQLAFSAGVVWAIRDKEVVAVDATSLAIIGTINALTSTLPVVTAGDLVILTTETNELRALHRQGDGKIAAQWEKKLPAAPVSVPALHQDKLLVLLPDGTLLSYHLPDGEEQQKLSFGRGMASGPAIIEQSLVGVAADGSVIRLPLP